MVLLALVAFVAVVASAVLFLKYHSAKTALAAVKAEAAKIENELFTGGLGAEIVKAKAVIARIKAIL